MAAQLKTDLVGLQAREVRSCMGLPWDMNASEDRSLWIYRLPYPADRQEVEIQIPQGPGTAAAPPNVTRGEAESDTVKSSSFGRLQLRQKVQPGSCYLFFGFEDQVVREFDAAGRSYQNTNADAECALLARSCLP